MTGRATAMQLNAMMPSAAKQRSEKIMALHTFLSMPSFYVVYKTFLTNHVCTYTYSKKTDHVRLNWWNKYLQIIGRAPSAFGSLGFLCFRHRKETRAERTRLLC